MSTKMKKNLDEMTNEELWQLFPIVLNEHKPVWGEEYKKEKSKLERVVGLNNIARISHIGSTAVPGLIAKPTIDILLELQQFTDTVQLVGDMKAAGYRYLAKPENVPPHMMFTKGYTPDGYRGQVFHIHVRYSGDWDELYFRDYLLAHPETAAEYGRLKVSLQDRYKHDRDGYTNAKGDFIKHITLKARNTKKSLD